MSEHRRAIIDDRTTEAPADDPRRSRARPATRARLVVLYDADTPERAGETLLLEGPGPFVLGRGEAAHPPVAQRPGVNLERPPWSNPRLSRTQCEVSRLSDSRLAIENRGRMPLLRDGQAVQQTMLGPGDVVALGDQILLGCVRRPQTLSSSPYWPHPAHALGEPDLEGIVGESAAAWALRDRIGFVAQRKEHALVLGPSGAGKELVARALHRLGARAEGPFVAHNAATIPEGLTDAELFGIVADYPNAGSPARRGLLEEADGGSLFLDEIGEIPQSMQARLLRFMDGGEYRRLGADRAATADVRVLAATNRGREALKDDLGARFFHQIEVPTLADRLEDVPLIAQHLLRGMLASEPALAARLCDEASGHPRLDLALLVGLWRHPLPLQVRQLQSLLWRAVGASPGGRIEALDDLPRPEAAAVDPARIDRATLARALEEVGGSHREVATHLGLKNRYVLRRLLKKHGLG